MSSRLWISIFLFSYGINAWGQPWIAPDNLSSRSSITYLQQQGIIHAPISTWPLAWQGIAEDLDHCVQQPTTPTITNLCQTLLNEYHASQTSHITASAYVANDQTLLNSFDKNYRGKSGSQFNFSAQNQNWSGQLSLNQVDASTDRHAINVDGSYLAAHSNNWALGVGAIDRWWGPSWDSSLILSTNPRPIPGLFLTRTTNKPFESIFLNWIGPWNFTTTLGQLESNREIPNTLFLGIRFNFQPWTPLEIGLSRTAQWGGEGRSHSLNTLGNLLIGYDNAPGLEEPGNQLAGFDATLSFPIKNYTSAVYFQYIGEDEAGGLPAKSLGLAGASLSKANINNHWTAFIETSDTAVNVLSSDEFNLAYEHHLYTDGYRYYGRAIGSAYDNDTHTLTAGLTGTVNEIYQFSATASNIDFNLDGNSSNGLVSGAQKSQRYALSYKQKNALADWGFTLSTLTHLPENKQLVDKKDNLVFFVSREFK